MTSRRPPSPSSFARLLTPVLARGLALSALALVGAACADDAAGTPAAEIRGDGAPFTPVSTPSGSLVGDVAFGPAVVGGAAVSVRLTIASTGTAPLTLTGSPAVRLERDDRLAFSVVQPDVRVIAPGAVATFDVAFGPRATGTTTARLVIATDAPASPELVIGLQGQGVVEVAPAVDVTIAGLPVDDETGGSHAFPRTFTGDRATAELVVIHRAGPAIDLSGDLSGPALAVTGPDAAAFSVDALAADTLAPGETTATTVTFAPTRCGPHEASLRVTVAGVREIALTGEAAVAEQRFAEVTDPAQLTADAGVSASADGTLLAIANPTADTFAGQVELLAFDGCEVGAAPALTGDDLGYEGSLFGSSALLGGGGDAARWALVAARDHRPVWLVDPAPAAPGGADVAPVTLSTADPGVGFGRAAALSSDGAVAAVGQPLTATRGHTHGAIFAYRRGAGAWASRGEADAKLVAPVFAEVSQLGQAVAISADGGVIAGATVRSAVGASRAVAACVWRADGATWGLPRVATNAFVRDPHAILQARDGDPSDGAARVGVSGDGATVVLSAAQAGGSVNVYVFAAADDGWGVPSGVEGVAHETARLRLAATPAWRFAVAADGSFIVGADAAGIAEFARPPAGWIDGLEPTRTWPAPLVGGVALGADDAFIAGVDPEGALRVLWR